MVSEKNYVYKVCVVGDGGVGKTSLVRKSVNNTFSENYIMTIGSNFSVKSVELPEYPNYDIKLSVWDLAGQEHFKVVRPPFYKGAKAIIYVYDLTRISSFSNILNWKKEAEKVIGSTPNILVGNKLDLIRPEEKRAKEEDINELMGKLNTDAYFETSAKEGINVEAIFEEVTKKIINNSAKINIIQ
ncbi:MAG: GTP-binding protein [Promethearchaeota archaeon]